VRKRLGQVFLRDKNILRKIVDEVPIEENQWIVEIGSGYGNLTKFLLERGASVIAIEIEKQFVRELEENLFLYIGGGRLKVIEGDYLSISMEDYLRKERISPPLKIVANIPYYITSSIIEKIVRERELYSEIYITLQREVAERLVSVPGKSSYGSLTILVNCHYEPSILFRIRRGSFSPPPKVDSAFVRLVRKKEEPPAEEFFSFVRKLFKERRKKLRNVLKKMVPSNLNEIEKNSGISLVGGQKPSRLKSSSVCTER